MIPPPVRRIAEYNLPGWHQADDGDTIYGIETIAAYLGLPFLDVRTMIEMGRLPVRKDRCSHVTRRSDLVRHFLALERAAVPPSLIAAPPDDLRPDGALGLLSGQHAIAAHLGCSHAGVRHRRAKLGLHTFWVGKTPFARKPSLDRWAEHAGGDQRSSRRLASIKRNWRSAAPEGALVGADEIATYLGRSRRAVYVAICRGQLPVDRSGPGLIGDPVALAPFIKLEKDRRHGKRHQA